MERLRKLEEEQSQLEEKKSQIVKQKELIRTDWRRDHSLYLLLFSEPFSKMWATIISVISYWHFQIVNEVENNIDFEFIPFLLRTIGHFVFWIILQVVFGKIHDFFERKHGTLPDDAYKLLELEDSKLEFFESEINQKLYLKVI